jgi:predicted branched-subunit amino acid permease
MATTIPTTSAPRAGALVDLLAGARAMAPWLVGIVPFGLVIGVAAAHADIPTSAGWLTGPLIFGGSAQVAVIDLLDAGATPALVVLAALAVNLRLVLYSATMARHWKGQPRWWQALAAYFLVDPSLAVGTDAYERTTDPARAHRRYMGAAILLWFAWVGAISIGATAGTRLPAWLHLELVIPLFLAGEVAARATSKAARTAATTAAFAAVLATPVPLHLAPVVAIAAGLAAGIRTSR